MYIFFVGELAIIFQQKSYCYYLLVIMQQNQGQLVLLFEITCSINFVGIFRWKMKRFVVMDGVDQRRFGVNQCQTCQFILIISVTTCRILDNPSMVFLQGFITNCIYMFMIYAYKKHIDQTRVGDDAPRNPHDLGLIRHVLQENVKIKGRQK